MKKIKLRITQITVYFLNRKNIHKEICVYLFIHIYTHGETLEDKPKLFIVTNFVYFACGA